MHGLVREFERLTVREVGMFVADLAAVEGFVRRFAAAGMGGRYHVVRSHADSIRHTVVPGVEHRR